MDDDRMANLPNRPQYGNISCIFAIFKSRYVKNGIFTPGSLKFDGTHPSNAIDICPGSNPLHSVLGSKYTPTRNYVCPHFKSTSGALLSVCQMVHSEKYDGQNSRPVGSAVIMLEALGLSQEVNLGEFPSRKNQKWTNFAYACSKFNWGDPVLTSLLQGKLSTYGPLIHLAMELKKRNNSSITRVLAKVIFTIVSSNDSVDVICPGGTKHSMSMNDGNTSADTPSRNTTTLMYLAMALGLVSTSTFSASGEPTDIVGVSNWLNNNPKMTAPKKFDVNMVRVNQLLSNPTLSNAIYCKYFTTKGTHRNSGLACTCGCGSKNLYNNAKKKYDGISRQRKLLLCEALAQAKRRGKKLDLNTLSKLSETNQKFALKTSTHLNELTNVELHNVSLFGAIHSIDNNLITPEISIPANTFGHLDSKYIDAGIMTDINTILSAPGLFK